MKPPLPLVAARLAAVVRGGRSRYAGAVAEDFAALTPPGIVDAPLAPRDWDIAQIVDAVHEFEQRLIGVKQGCSLSEGRQWYEYHSFSSIDWLDGLLTGERRKLLALMEGYPVLDIGCGDGDLAFFFESLGNTVHALDHPATNYNMMEGIHMLKTALGSSVEILDVDLDRQFELPRQTYGLAMMFGVLYHLKNPFFVLESLAKRARYCLLSTRIARYTPDHQTELRDVPVAYLVGGAETNDDLTNFWIFSEVGLRRLFERTGWIVRDFTSVGARETSDPSSPEHDERAFCLLESGSVALHSVAKLAAGWYDLEGNVRWTGKRFSFVIPKHAANVIPEVRLRFILPALALAARPSMTLTAWVNGVRLRPHTYSEVGEHVYHEKVPGAAVGLREIEIVFETDEPVRPAPPDKRLLGVLVPFDAWFPLSLT